MNSSFTAYAFCGPRKVTKDQQDRVYEFLEAFPLKESKKPILVGDAPGLDALIRLHFDHELFEVQGHKKSDFARRTIRMIDALAAYQNPCLYAFINKHCPVGCKPSKAPSGKGSGTWLAIAAAKHRNISIKLVKLGNFDLPDWLSYSQLSLF